MKHIRTIINKEWSEVFKNKMVLSVVLVMPILFSLLPLVMLGVTSTTSMLDITRKKRACRRNLPATSAAA